MQVVKFFELIRYKNLLIIGITQSLLKFVLFPKFIETSNLSLTQFLLLVFSTILIAAAGNIYNDIIDFKVDLINKKSKTIINRFITKQTAIIWVFVLNSIALILGAYLCYQLDNYWLIILFFVSITLLILYSKWLKSIVLIGNVTVSILVSLSILIVAFFEFIPLKSDVFYIVLALSFFAFTLNLIREIIKDIEDINGDLANNLKTLPIIIGRKRAKRVTLYLSFVFASSLIAIIILSNNDIKILKIYLILAVIIPLLYFISKLRIAKSKKHYSFLSKLLKMIMVTGILSIFTI